MNINNQNNKYTIWLYNLNSREYNLLIKEFPKEHFEVIDIMNDYTKFETLQKQKLLDKPDIVICDMNTEITNELRNILYKSCCGLAKVTTKSIDDPFASIFQLNDEKIEIMVKKNKIYMKQLITKKDFSIQKIIDLCQLSNIGKLQKLMKIEADNIIKTIDLNQELNSRKSISYVSREYLFKLAHTLNEIISLKDNYTAGHCQRVAIYSEALGHALNLSNSQIEDLILAAYLHDIGKIGLPDAVITKTSKLNDLEFNLMKKHVELGSSILPTEQLGYLKEAVRGHHEKYDGTGYPDGLKGENISLFAQILAIADSFDAMTSQRSYNKVKSAEEAFDDLIRHTKPKDIEGGLGMFYNPILVDKFVETISNSKTIMENLHHAKELADQKMLLNEQKEMLQREMEIQNEKNIGGNRYAWFLLYN